MRLVRSFALASLLAGAPLSAQSPQKELPREAPKGWLGVLITTGIGQTNGRGGLIFHDYPVIESVDPGSPAEKAGLMAGDVLLSINSQDFKKNPVPMHNLLVPGRKVVFHYRRDNVAKKIALTVAERPAGTSARTQITFIGPDIARAQRAHRELMIQRAATRVPVAPSVSIAPLLFGTGPATAVVAGAELTQLSDGLREAMNVSGDGILVVNVVVPSLADDAGLRSGDVITKVEKQVVQNPGQLIALISEAQAQARNALLLHILRKQKEHTLRLRW